MTASSSVVFSVIDAGSRRVMAAANDPISLMNPFDFDDNTIASIAKYRESVAVENGNNPTLDLLGCCRVACDARWLHSDIAIASVGE